MSPRKSDMAAAADNVDEVRRNAVHGHGPHALPVGGPGLADIGKDTVARSPQDELSAESGLARESWVSFTSTTTSRVSGVPSIFSARASTASAMTRYSVRQSLLESPVLAASPVLYRDHRKSGLPPAPPYRCTFCDTAFETKTEWKLHEFEFHDRAERYFCSTCPATFARAVALAEHLQGEHGLDSADVAAGAIRCSPIRSAWGCGFCALAIPSRTEYLEHVGEHYDEGKDKSDWQHTRVIEGLLEQPRVASTWRGLVGKEEKARGAKLRFFWDLDTTGRSSDPEEHHSLQDVLEFFAAGTRSADEAAALAFSSAHIRSEGNVSDLVGKLHLRMRALESSELSAGPSQPHLEPQPTSSMAQDDLVSQISPLPAPVRPFTSALPSHAPHSHPSDAGAAVVMTARPHTGPRRMPKHACVSGDVAPLDEKQDEHIFRPLPQMHRTLRRVDSARDLEVLKQTVPIRDPGSHTSPLSSKTRPSWDHPTVATATVARPTSQSPAPRGPVETSAAYTQKGPGTVFSARSSVRTHTSSSTLSTQAGDGSQGLDDSVSEMLSDDSLSEPDLWLESDVIPRATKTWTSTFQQSIARAMGWLWARYIDDWEALVRQCVGGGAGDSAQVREFAGRVRKSTSTRRGPNRGPRPHGGPFGQEDEDEDDEGDIYRPPSSLSKRSHEGAKRFACPFRKHDPNTYNIHDHEVCAIRSWSTISRLKEHLYRRHYKTHCQRCKQIFSDARELAEHELSVAGCEVVDTVPPSDITTYQEKQLKSRKHTTRRQSDEEKWRDIYRLLFPDEAVPSPYPEPAEDMAPAASESHASLTFQHFLLAEMPSLFTKAAEERAGRSLQAHDGLAMEAIPGIIQEALHKAFRAWESGGSELPTRAASAASMALRTERPAPVTYPVEQPTAYQAPRPAPSMGNYPQGHFENMNFVPELAHTTHADDSGFSEAGLFATAAPVNFNAFTPQYEREHWEGCFAQMGGSAFGGDMGMGDSYRGFRGN